jgi:hypothetical protein
MARFPLAVEVVARLPAHSFLLDGEVSDAITMTEWSLADRSAAQSIQSEHVSTGA